MDATTAVKLAANRLLRRHSGFLSLNLPGWSAPWTAAQPILGNTAFIGYDGSSQYAVAIRLRLSLRQYGAGGEGLLGAADGEHPPV